MVRVFRSKYCFSTTIFKGYTARQIRPAARADAVTMARAMNRDFAPKAKAMFQSEIDAARDAIEQDLYISYRQPGKDFDCYRIGSIGKCFCGHTLSEHTKYTGIDLLFFYLNLF